MTHAQVGSLELVFETFGDESGEPILLVMGLGGPMIWWPDDFCHQLAAHGFYVIRFDNRDAGRSSTLESPVRRSQIVAAFFGAPVNAPYSIADMAQDAFGVLDHLGIEAAHIVGMSMGGMIVQTMAITAPHRVKSLTSIMSTTGARAVGWQDPRIIPALLSPSVGEAGYIASSIRLAQLIGSPGYVQPPAVVARAAKVSWEYGVRPAGTARQMLAVLSQPNRTAALGQLNLPALVIHGLEDRMVHVSGGRATSMAIPGSELLEIKGMGHDLPEPLWETFISAIVRTASRSQSVSD